MKLCLVCLLAVLVVSSTCAATSASQTLAWGVEDGQEFSFRLQEMASDQGLTLDESMLFRVDSVPDLSEIFAVLQRIPIVPVSAYWANGTEIVAHHQWYMWVDRLVLPIGDWYLVESRVLQETVDKYDLLGSDDFWGFQWWTTLEEVTVGVRAVYYKADGFLSHYSYTETESGADSARYVIDAARTDIPFDILSSLSFIYYPPTGILIAVISAVILVTVSRRRHIKRRGASTDSLRSAEKPC